MESAQDTWSPMNQPSCCGQRNGWAECWSLGPTYPWAGVKLLLEWGRVRSPQEIWDFQRKMGNEWGKRPLILKSAGSWSLLEGGVGGRDWKRLGHEGWTWGWKEVGERDERHHPTPISIPLCSIGQSLDLVYSPWPCGPEGTGAISNPTASYPFSKRDTRGQQHQHPVRDGSRKPVQNPQLWVAFFLGCSRNLKKQYVFKRTFFYHITSK